MARSLKKGPFVDSHLAKKVETAIKEKSKNTNLLLISAMRHR